MPALDDAGELARRVAAAPVGRLATLRPDGTPRLVPVTFAAVPAGPPDLPAPAPPDVLLCFAVDEVKPKRHPRLARLADIARDDRIGLLVDHYDADWSTLWWVRVDGRAAVHVEGPLRDRALAALTAKYPAYRARPPAGPVVVITPTRWTGWSAS